MTRNELITIMEMLKGIYPDKRAAEQLASSYEPFLGNHSYEEINAKAQFFIQNDKRSYKGFPTPSDLLSTRMYDLKYQRLFNKIYNGKVPYSLLTDEEKRICPETAYNTLMELSLEERLDRMNDFIEYLASL